MHLNLEQKQLLTKARVLGQGRSLPVQLSDLELTKLIMVILFDTGNEHLLPPSIIVPCKRTPEYYEIPLQWFSEPGGYEHFYELYSLCIEQIEDFETYFKCLCELHKRRRKYAMILEAQPLPTMLQVAPRSLLEYGALANPALASWITWKKWFYDIDNRAAQETGYLFEPILANALGGSPFSARTSPIKRTKDRNKGRQVDCIAGEDAYEFKLRVTVAASGQGRFGEEIDFAADCRASGFNPVLVVLDPTPSHRLTDLAEAFAAAGGSVYVGEEAWKHLEQRSGPTMATFIEKYVRAPISQMDRHQGELLDLCVSARNRPNFEIRIGNSLPWHLVRREDPGLNSDNEQEYDDQ